MILQKCQLVTSLPCLKPFKSFPITVQMKSRLVAVAFQILLSWSLLQPRISSFSCCPPHSLHCGHISPHVREALPHSGLSVLAGPLSGCPPYDSSCRSSFSYSSSAHCEVLATTSWMMSGWLLESILTSGEIQRKDFQPCSNPEGDRFQGK